MHPEKDGMSKKFQPDRCQIDNNTDEWKYNQPDSNSLADVEKKNKNSHENKDCAHTENMDVGKFQVVIKKKIERQPSRELPQIKK